MIRRKRQISEVEVVQLLDIPSDSDISDITTDELSDEEYSPDSPAVSHYEESDENDSDNQDSQDDNPLSEIQKKGRENQNDSTIQSNKEINVSWKKSFNCNPVPPFTASGGPSDLVLELSDPSPIILFSKLFPSEYIEQIVFQTNLYATQKGKQFKPTDLEEFQTFLGINLLMGIKRLPSYKDYWSSMPELRDNYISNHMTVNRFGWLLSHLHLNDNSVCPNKDEPGYDRLYKLRPFLQCIGKTFSECYSPQETQAVDESMIKFKGRSSYKQYMPKKPIKRGYKVWMRCDKSGYCMKFEIYSGKTGNKPDVGLGKKVVLEMCKELENKNHHVYFDNYFNSYPLQAELLEKGIYACGTVNSTRKHLPTLKTDKEMKRGDNDWRSTDSGISCIKWKDKRSVLLLSNFQDPQQVSEVERKEKDGSKTKVPCPQIVRDYNSNMGFVDQFDQLKSCYEIDRKSRKWWMRIFFHFLDVCVTNAFILHKTLPSVMEKLKLKAFRLEVIQGLVTNKTLSNKTRSKPLRETIQVKKRKPFVPLKIRMTQSEHQPLRGNSRRCALCSTKSAPHRTKWCCKTCNVPLCLSGRKNCFQDFHGRMNISSP